MLRKLTGCDSGGSYSRSLTSAPGQARETSTISGSACDEVIAPTTVLDKDGAYVTGLKPMEFRLYDNDKPQTIKVDEVVQPVSLVVAVQADYKVEAVLPKIQKIGTMLQNMVAGDGGEVAVVGIRSPDTRCCRTSRAIPTRSRKV